MSTTAALPELLYLYDPLCAWCYGQGPAILTLQAQYAGRLNVSILCGGAATGDEAGPLAEKWPAWQPQLAEVARVTGATFGPAFRALGAAGRSGYDSEPPSRAIGAFRQLTGSPARTVAFAHAVQTAFFRDGHDLGDLVTYQRLLADYEVSTADFERVWQLPATARATRQEFAAVARTGVAGLPTTVVRLEEQGYVLARGYQPLAQLQAGLEQLLNA